MGTSISKQKALLHRDRKENGKVPESEDGNGFVTSDVPWFWGASVIGMANSSLVIGLGVSNTGGGMLLRSWLVNEGVMVRFARCCWLLGELVIQYSLLAG
jgi:hypothetical protein